jgi:hypothetical protein
MTLALILAALETAGLVSLLIWLLVFAVVIYVLYLILGMLPIPEPVKTILLCVVGIILLIVLVQRLGLI